MLLICEIIPCLEVTRWSSWKDLSHKVPSTKSLLSLPVKSKTQCSTKIEQVIIDVLAMQLYTSYDRRQGTTVKQHLNNNLM